MLDPNRSEVCLKLHWVYFHLPNSVVRAALEPYGNVDVARDS